MKQHWPKEVAATSKNTQTHFQNNANYVRKWFFQATNIG